MQWLHSKRGTRLLLWSCSVLITLVILPLQQSNIEQRRRLQAEVLSAARLTVDGPTYPSEPADRGGSPQSMIDANPHTWWFGKLPGDRPLVVDLAPKEPVRMTKLVISYAENRAPTHVVLEIKQPGDQTFTEAAQFLNPKPDPQGITLRIRPAGSGILIEVMRLKMYGAEQPDGIVRIHELRLIEDL